MKKKRDPLTSNDAIKDALAQAVRVRREMDKLKLWALEHPTNTDVAALLLQKKDEVIDRDGLLIYLMQFYDGNRQAERRLRTEPTIFEKKVIDLHQNGKNTAGIIEWFSDEMSRDGKRGRLAEEQFGKENIYDKRITRIIEKFAGQNR